MEIHASLFRNGCNQAVRIPRDFEFESSEVLMRKEGDQLILTPIRKNRPLNLPASWQPLMKLCPRWRIGWHDLPDPPHHQAPIRQRASLLRSWPSSFWLPDLGSNQGPTD